MSEHYYTSTPTSESNKRPFNITLLGHALVFFTDAGVFSKGELDKGTALLLNNLPPLSGHALDLGCGWGAIGITLKKLNPDLQITMADINERAVALTKENVKKNGITANVIQSDGFESISEAAFDSIISNPPIRAGKQVIYALFEESHRRLKTGGCLYLVIRKQQGADSARAFLKTFFKEVSVLKKSGGFDILQAIK
jgi:16S RNA G1207 methylase RsmC